MYIYICIYISMMHKRFEGLSCRFALWELVHNLYKSIPPDQNGQVHMKNSTMLTNTNNTMLWCTCKFMHICAETCAYIFSKCDNKEGNDNKGLGWAEIYIFIDIYLCIHTSIHISISIYIYMYKYMYMYRYVYICVHINIYICVCEY